ncbi:hypothetical protein E4U21_004860 [Claviceps maximensis]|nr:hypothetical protein E4U21_004860 [Claviceps maximensis]
MNTVGRGGAGNVYSVEKQDELPAKKDLERQDKSTRPVIAPADASSGLRGAGRGGAGNFIDATHEEERHVASDTISTADPMKHSRDNKDRMGGRGGAGNWTGHEGLADGGEHHEDNDEGSEWSRTEELKRKVTEVVEKGLKIPQQVHHAREKDVKP